MPITLCIKCGHYMEADISECYDTCLSPEAPYKEFVDGKKYCIDINTKGDCKFCSPKDGHESIYESKEDKDLANTTRED